jgi:hypothetical protein
MSKEEIICKSCGVINDYTITIVGAHHKAVCNGCGKYIKFVHYAPPTFYIGKYKGTKVSECSDKEYMEWYLYNIQRIPETMKQALQERINELTI